METVAENTSDNTNVKVAAEATALVLINEERDHMLRGLDGEASAVQIQASFFDRGVGAALKAVQDNFYLVPKVAIVDDEIVAVDTSSIQGRSTADLATEYYQFVNN